MIIFALTVIMACVVYGALIFVVIHEVGEGLRNIKRDRDCDEYNILCQERRRDEMMREYMENELCRRAAVNKERLNQGFPLMSWGDGFEEYAREKLKDSV
jgi:hypothetical protein